MAYWAPTPEGQLYKKCDLWDMKDEQLKLANNTGAELTSRSHPSWHPEWYEMIGAIISEIRF